MREPTPADFARVKDLIRRSSTGTDEARRWQARMSQAELDEILHVVSLAEKVQSHGNPHG